MSEMIQSLDEYIKEAKTYKDRYCLSKASINPWFRGHSDIEYLLKPSLYRVGNEAIRGCEREILRDFKLILLY